MVIRTQCRLALKNGREPISATYGITVETQGFYVSNNQNIPT